MARPQTAMNAHGGMQKNLAEQHKTSLIYGKIRDQRYGEAVKLLNEELERYPNSRAGLSLIGYCYYYMQEFGAAADAYERLVKQCPNIHEYRVYYAQSLYKAGLYDQALRACHAAENDAQSATRILQLQAAIRYEQDDLSGCRALLEEGSASAPDNAIAHACLAFKEDRFEDSLQELAESKNQLGYALDLAYNMALCHYKLGQYGLALKHVAEIIERGVHEHPELSIGSNADGIEVHSVGNSQILKESMLIEAFNLKAAIEFQLKNGEAAQEALSDMPPRSEDELDAVTLHNYALMHMDIDPNAGLRKLNFLLSQASFPPETFGNLLLMYCKLQYYDLAADVLAQNGHLHESHLGEELYEYLEATILVQSSPEEAYRKFDELSTKHVDMLRKLTKSIQDARIARDNTLIKACLKQYDAALERYMPVLMSQAKIYWDRQNYAQVERIFKQSAEFCSDHEAWRLNVGHVFFMQDNKFKDAIRYYEPIVKQQASSSVLDVTAMVLANLCVSYIMTSQNDVAQELMNQIEKEEEHSEYGDVGSGGSSNGRQLYHLCIVNLVIGTLYCAKSNYKFGISRIMKSLEPFEKKLSPDTWYYAKRCLLALCENFAKQMMVFNDDFFYDVIQFLEAIEETGSTIKTMVNLPAGSEAGAAGGEDPRAFATVASEARKLKHFFLKLRE